MKERRRAIGKEELNGGRALGGTLFFLCAIQLVMAYDTTAMNVAISRLVVDLHTTLTSIQAVISIYALVMAAAMITGAKLLDILGRARCLTLGALIYAAGALLTSLSRNVAMLALGWSVLEGLGAALTLPAILTLGTELFEPGTSRTRALALIGATAAVGAALGPIFGGLITTYLTWRVSFALEVVIIVLTVWSMRHLKAGPPVTPRPRLDLVGTLLTALGFGSIVFGTVQASRYGFLKTRIDVRVGDSIMISAGGVSPTLLLIALGLLFLGLFAVWEKWGRSARGKEPLVPLSILEHKDVSRGLPLLVMLFAVIAGVMFTVPVFAQLSLAYDAFRSGLVLLPLSASIMAFSLGGARMSRRLEARHVIRVGFIVLAGGCLLLALSITSRANGWSLAPSLVVVGAGIGLVASVLQNLVSSAVPPSQVTDVSGVSRSFGNLGSSLGTAIVGAILLVVLVGGLTGAVSRSALLEQAQKDQLASRIEQDIQTLSNAQVEAYLNAQAPSLSDELRSEIVQIYGESRDDGMRLAAAILAGISFLAFLLTFLLPEQ
jgi:MFS family permease